MKVPADRYVHGRDGLLHQSLRPRNLHRGQSRRLNLAAVRPDGRDPGDLRNDPVWALLIVNFRKRL